MWSILITRLFLPKDWYVGRIVFNLDGSLMYICPIIGLQVFHQDKYVGYPSSKPVIADQFYSISCRVYKFIFIFCKENYCLLWNLDWSIQVIVHGIHFLEAKTKCIRRFNMVREVFSGMRIHTLSNILSRNKQNTGFELVGSCLIEWFFFCSNWFKQSHKTWWITTYGIDCWNGCIARKMKGLLDIRVWVHAIIAITDIVGIIVWQLYGVKSYISNPHNIYYTHTHLVIIIRITSFYLHQIGLWIPYYVI